MDGHPAQGAGQFRENQLNAGDQLRHYKADNQGDNGNHGHKGRQHAHRPAALPGGGLPAFGEVVPLVKAHQDIDHVGQHRADDQRRCRAQQGGREARQRRPVVDCQIQQKNADAHLEAGLSLHFHIQTPFSGMFFLILSPVCAAVNEGYRAFWLTGGAGIKYNERI